MKPISKSLLLAAAMIGVALLSIAGIIPEAFAQWAPLALLAAFPGAWLGKSRRCARNNTASEA